MRLSDALALGRVSNLPTVWTNAIAGIVISGGHLGAPGVYLLFIALTLFYVGGMYLNDYFDADVDAVERPGRPIPAGRVSARSVGIAGFSMLGFGILLMIFAGIGANTSPAPALAGVALAGAIVFYNWHHKGNALSPLVMGICRMLVYVCAAATVVATPSLALWLAACVLLCYLIGLTYTAKQENIDEIGNLWPLLFLAVPFAVGIYHVPDEPDVLRFLVLLGALVLVALYFIRRRGSGDIPRAVVSLIAGISLVDAVLVAAYGSLALAFVCVAGFLLTLVLQRFVSGT